MLRLTLARDHMHDRFPGPAHPSPVQRGEDKRTREAEHNRDCGNPARRP